MTPRIDLLTPLAGDLVLLAHGGQEHSTAEPHLWRAPLLRMWSLARAARREVPDAAVGLLRYRYRGWNGDDADAAADLRAVLDALPDDVGRVALIGHSMGGRAVMRLGDHGRVRGVLALAPWLPEADPLVEPHDRVVVLAHGADDRITDPALTTRYAGKLRAAGVPVADLLASGEQHALLHRPADWAILTRHFVADTLASGSRLAQFVHTDPSRPPDPLPRWSARQGPLRELATIALSRLTLRIRGQVRRQA